MTFGTPKLYIDIETRSDVDLKAAGARRYAADPSTQITTASWRWAGDPRSFDACNVRGLEHLGNSSMAQFKMALYEAHHIVAHHINFDASVIFATLGPCGMTLEKLDCTMARAQRMSLPGGLDALCESQQLQGKSLDGHRLVMATCKPRKDGTFNEDPAVYRQLLAYNVQDVRCLEAVDKILPPLPPDELEIWRRTWRKNALGLPLDIELCQRIAAKRHEIELQLSRDLRSLTGGAVATVSQNKRIVEWMHKQGVKIPNLQKATVESWLDMEDMPLDAYQVLTHLFESGGSAPVKAQALLDRQVDGIYQDGTRYFGARSGRGTSEGVNFFNLARPSGKHDTEQVIARLKAQPDGTFDNTELSDVLRGAVVAPPGFKLLDVDLSNIELRLSLWFANDREKLDLLGSGKDLYATTAGPAMGIPGLTKKTHPKERQCFTDNTLVLTQSGWKRIVEVGAMDAVWDGVEWVNHSGVHSAGCREVLTVAGVRVTDDHLILCGKTWRPTKELVADESLIQSALETASVNLPLRAILCCPWTGSLSVLWSSVTAGLKSTLQSHTYFAVGLLKRASSVVGAMLGALRRATTAIATLPRTLTLPVIWPGVFQTSTVAASTQSTTSTSTTEDGASAFMRRGWKALRKTLLKTPGASMKVAHAHECATDLLEKWPFFSIWSACRGAITLNYRLIASIIIAATNRATFVLQRELPTSITEEPSNRCKKNSTITEVYDLTNCGPRQRFTILTSRGPVLAHNCFKKVVLSGGYAIGVVRLFAAFKTDKDLPYEYRKDLTYAQVAAIHAGYRDANWRLQACWKELDQAARAALANRGAIVPVCGGKLNFLWRRDADILDLRLPSGRMIPHYQPRISDEGELIFYRAKYGRMLESRAFGGSWLEIACQSAARDVLTGVERQVEAELPDVRLMLDIYDSIVALAPAAVAEQRMHQIINIMRRVPAWAEGLPLDAEGYVADRMQK